MSARSVYTTIYIYVNIYTHIYQRLKKNRGGGTSCTSADRKIFKIYIRVAENYSLSIKKQRKVHTVHAENIHRFARFVHKHTFSQKFDFGKCFSYLEVISKLFSLFFKKITSK